MERMAQSVAEAAADGGGELGKLPEWDLSDLYAGRDSEQLKADLARCETDAGAFVESYKGKLDALARQGGLVDAVVAYEALSELLGRIGSFAYLQYATATTDPERAKFLGDMNEKLTALTTPLLFFTLELNRIDDAVLEAAFAADEKLSRYKPWFDELRKARPYQLEDRVEELFHDKSVTGRAAWNRLFDETMASLRFEVDGDSLSLERTLTLLTDKDPKKREGAFHGLTGTLSDNLRLFTHITNVMAKDKEISDRWRGYKDVADSRHLANSVEPEVVEALVSAVRDAYPRLSHRYYRMKADWFGMDKLNAWDRSAPLPQEDDRVFDWAQAKSIVRDAYGRFSPELAEVADPFFDSGWIDAPVKDGKSPGAFAHPTVPSAHPYLMLNYLGKARDVMTLAHELGHGVHQRLAAPQGPLLSQTPLTLAETASVFGEMLTFRSILAATDDKQRRFALLAHKVEDMLNTVVRQIAFYTFERKVHIARRQGELRSAEISEFWLEAGKESLGEAFIFNEGYEIFWAYVPHFIHSPFYVYAYAFGDCLVNSLYAQYENAPEGFAERYLDLLRAGGSKHHSELLAPFGLDARDPGFWGLGLGMIEGLIDELAAAHEGR